MTNEDMVLCNEVKRDLTDLIKEIKKDIEKLEAGHIITKEDVFNIKLRLDRHSDKIEENMLLAREFRNSIDTINLNIVEFKKVLNSFKFTIIGAVAFYLLQNLGLIEAVKLFLK